MPLVNPSEDVDTERTDGGEDLVERTDDGNTIDL